MEDVGMSELKYQSNAEWAPDVYVDKDGSHISTDTHSTPENAQTVCNILELDGFGCQGEHFPIRTWVSEL